MDKKVKSKSFNLLLSLLLREDVPSKVVGDIAKNPEYYFVDAREKIEYHVSHIQNAVFAGYSDFELERVRLIPKDAPIMVYCSVGKRSQEITNQLISAGYSNVYNLYGGIFEWVNMGNPVYDNKGKQTNKIHAFSKAWGIWLRKGEKVY